MKKLLLLPMLLLVFNLGLSQEWAGAGTNTTTGDIGRTGSVGLGTNFPSSIFQVGNQTTAASNYYILFGKRTTSSQNNMPFIGQDSFDTIGNDLGLGARSGNGSINFYSGNANAFTSNNIRMRILSDGKVGIGTTTPNQKLEIKGGDGVGIRIYNDNANTWDILNSVNGQLDFVRGGSNTFMRINQLGRVGIGTTSPDANSLLTVNGKILCEEVEVIQDVLPDYVFQKYYTGSSSLKEDYTMLTLEDIEAFTKTNHHLPEVPSAAEVKENGMQLKDMTTILLQKVEELTLYTIEQEKRINALEAKLNKKQ
nr:hypothetical protein [uncultured Psychroserpens sp.]